MKWVDGRWVVAWTHYDTFEGGDSEACVTWFDDTGEMTDPPVCNLVTPAVGTGPIGIAAGDLGLALVSVSESGRQMIFLRTDLRGVAIGPPVAAFTGEHPTSHGAYDTVWADSGFAILTGLDWSPPGLWLQYFTAVP